MFILGSFTVKIDSRNAIYVESIDVQIKTPFPPRDQGQNCQMTVILTKKKFFVTQHFTLALYFTNEQK